MTWPFQHRAPSGWESHVLLILSLYSSIKQDKKKPPGMTPGFTREMKRTRDLGLWSKTQPHSMTQFVLFLSVTADGLPAVSLGPSPWKFGLGMMEYGVLHQSLQMRPRKVTQQQASGFRDTRPFLGVRKNVSILLCQWTSIFLSGHHTVMRSESGYLSALMMPVFLWISPSLSRNFQDLWHAQIKVILTLSCFQRTKLLLKLNFWKDHIESAGML